MSSKLAFLGATAVIALGAVPALAGSPAPVAPEPPIMAPAPQGPDWTGAYVGGELGWAKLKTDTPGAPSLDDSGVAGGLTAGYDFDMGKWVMGFGFDYDWADITLSKAKGANPKLDHVWRFKTRVGRKIGNGLAYVTGGYAKAEIKNTIAGSISDNGYVVGGGYDYMLSPKVALGGEALYHNFKDFGGTASDIDVWTFMARASLRF